MGFPQRPRRGTRRIAASVLAALLLTTGLTGADAATPIDSLAGAASVTATAQAVTTDLDVVSVYNRANALAPDLQARVAAAADSVRAAWALSRSASIGMDRVMRGASVVQQAPFGYHIPMGVSVLPIEAVGPLMGRNVSSVLAQGYVVLGSTTANIRRAQAGDSLDLVAAAGNIVTVVVGLVAPDDVVGGTEILMTPATADALGIDVVGRIIVWGMSSRVALDTAFAAYGIDGRADVRVRRSWAPIDPDATLGMATTKSLLGEFVYRVHSDGSIDTDDAWPAANLPAQREVLLAAIPIRARCHNAIRGDLAAALAEVAAAGLSGAIDVANANNYGGCYYPRFNRISGTLGFLSRHSWAQALDTNTVANAQGNVPKMNCDVVRIFRKHNFAWGGNFLTSDGMHFEWVGSRRDQYQYPSRYCPNLPATAGTESLGGTTPPATVNADQPGRATLFADDGFGNAD